VQDEGYRATNMGLETALLEVFFHGIHMEVGVELLL
jgi:hypothetical protein